MRYPTTLLFVLLLCTCGRAQICYDLSAEGRTLSISLIAEQDYVGVPANIYNTGLITLAWDESLGEDVIESINAPSPFPYNYDSGAPLARLINGTYYQKFSFSTQTREDLRTGEPLVILNVTVANFNVATGGFQIVPAPPAEVANGDAAIEHVIDANRFGGNGCNLEVTGVVLPLKFISFTATPTGKVAQLNWTTAQESGVDRQEVQRLSGSSSFITIGSQPAKNETANQYTYQDETVAPGNQYIYRIRAVDFDGAETFSDQQLIEFGSAINISPNPVSETLTVNYSDEYTASLMDQSGREVYRLPVANGQRSFSVRQFPAGTYVIIFKDRNNREFHTQKISIVH